MVQRTEFKDALDGESLKKFDAFNKEFEPYLTFSSYDETRRIVRMETISAQVLDVESGTSRNNQEFYRVKLDNGMTLYSYSDTKIKGLKPKTNYQFSCSRKGRFLHIEGFEQYIQQNDPNQTFPTGIKGETSAPWEDESDSTGGAPWEKSIETPTPPPQTNWEKPKPVWSPPRTNGNEKPESAMRRGAIAHGSLGKIMSGLAASGRFAEYSPEQIVAEMIYYAKAIEYWYVNGA